MFSKTILKRGREINMKFQSEKGYTVMDIAISIVVITIFISLIAVIISRFNSSASSLKYKEEATAIAIEEIELIKKAGLEAYKDRSIANGNSEVSKGEEISGKEVAEILSSPNNILGLEYAKAILKTNANVELLPIPRQGSGYSERGLTGEFASATAIREHVKTGEVQATCPYLPEVVYEDLKLADTTNRLSIMERTAILIKSKEDLRKILDCTEGLENAFKGAAEKTDEFVKELTSARYTASRLRRIALHNVLNIEESFIRNCLSSPLYLTPLAYKKDRTDLLSALSKASIPFLSSGKQIKALDGVAKQCYEKDEFASTVYDAITNTKTSNELVIV